MKRLLLLCALALLTGCPQGAPAQPKDQGAPELNLYIWSEYIDPQLVKDFEQRAKCKVNISLYESSEEMQAKLQHAAGASQYDLCVVPSSNVPLLARLELIRKLDHGKLTHLDHLAPRFRDPPYDKGSAVSVAYQWGTVGLLYDKQKHPQLDASWKVLFDPAARVGSFVLIDEMRDQLGIALRYLGKDVNTTELDALAKARDLLLEAKQDARCAGFEGGVGGKNRVVAGTVDMAVVWNGDAVKAIRQDQKGRLGYLVPREGSLLWADALVITKDAPHAELAYQFVDYLLEPEVGAKLSAFTKYATPNQKALEKVDPKDREDPAVYPPEEVLKGLDYVVDLGPKTQLYDEVWTAVKAR
ncbi:MAG: spermidine/putrescine ABC transporter substrate-binding protein [Planctomycetota bacterium]